MNNPANRSPPLVSVVIPAFNAAALLERTAYSLLDQTFSNLEIIIVDDGSSDDTLDLANSLAEKHPQIKVLHQPNSGVAAARNLGIRHSCGIFIAPVDADDVWFPQAVEQMVGILLESDERVGVAYAWTVAIDEEDRLDGRYRASSIEGDVSSTLVCHNFIGCASATIIRREHLDAVGGYDTRFSDWGATGCEDWDLYLRLSERCHFKVASDFHVGYRKSFQTMSTNADRMLQSHRLMLQNLVRRRTRVSPLLLGLSRSSFCLYLCDQACRRQDFRQSSILLRRALASSVPFTILRPNFYRLLAAHAMRAVLPRPYRASQRQGKARTVEDVRSRHVSRGLRRGVEALVHQWAKWLSHK